MLKDVKSENEVKMYAVILRCNHLVLGVYFLLELIFSTIMRRPAAVVFELLALGYFSVLFYATYHNKTKLVSGLTNGGIGFIITAHSVMYGYSISILNLIFIQIILLFAVDYVNMKWKLLLVGVILMARCFLRIYMSYHVPWIAMEEWEIIYWQGCHLLLVTVLLVVTIDISTQDFHGMQEKLVTYNEKLRNIASIDPLTRLKNRRGMMTYIEGLVHSYNKGEIEALSLAIADIDFFKRINDTYGHKCGDMVLQQLSQLFEEFMEKKGEAARWGGEEFLFVFKNINGDDAAWQLANLLKKVREYEFDCGDVVLKLTITIGLSEYDSRKAPEYTINDADKKLYMGKEQGRDQLVY